MDTLLPFLLVAVVCTVVGWGLVRLRRRVQRRRVGSAAMSAAMTVFDQIWHPAAADPQIEIQQSYERRAPAPAPDGDENEEEHNENDNKADDNKADDDKADQNGGNEDKADQNGGEDGAEGAGGPGKAAGADNT
jgi:hypothetical protein